MSIKVSLVDHFFICNECFSCLLDYNELLREYEEIKQENEALNEQYLGAELENFEITSYYEQVLAEEKAKTVRLEAERTGNTRSSPSTHPTPSTRTNR